MITGELLLNLDFCFKVQPDTLGGKRETDLLLLDNIKQFTCMYVQTHMIYVVKNFEGFMWIYMDFGHMNYGQKFVFVKSQGP